MRTLFSSITLALACCISLSAFAQSPSPYYPGMVSMGIAKCEKSENYKDCAAILYKGNVLVNEYSPRGFCKLETGMTGPLTVASVALDEEGATPGKNISFRVAIKNERTNTMWMFSDQVYEEVQLEDILRKIEKDDKIIIMTVDRKYSLPHHEIKVVWGC